MADWLLSTAEALDVDLIASLPDSLFYNLSLALRGSSDLTALWKLASAWQLETKLEGGLLDVGPSDVARLDRYRIDRAALTKLLAAQTPESCPNWDDQALYAATQPVGTYQFGLDYRWMRLVDPNLVWSTNYFRPVAFRIWGTLDAETRQSARSTLSIDRLSPHQIALIDEMHRSYLGGISPRQLGDYMGGKRPDVYSDESETKIRDGSFTVEQKPTPMFLARYSNGAEAKLSAIELAWLLTAKKKSYLPAEAIPVSVRDMNAARVTYFFEHSAGNSQMPLDPNYGKFGPEEKLDPLSSGLQAKLEKVIEEWKDAKFVDSPGGNLNPPPPWR